MRFSQESLRVARDVEVMTPAGWGLLEPGSVPFRFRLTLHPPTDGYLRFFQKQRASRSDQIAAYQAVMAGAGKASIKALSKEAKKEARITPSESRTRLQRIHDATRMELLEEIVQVFDDGREVGLTEDEVTYIFRVPDYAETAYPAVVDGAAGYEVDDVLGGEDEHDALRKNGESLAEALVRFIAFHSEKAKAQMETEKEEILRPLARTSDSSPGSGPSGASTDTAPPHGARAVTDAQPAGKSGNLAAVGGAKAATG